MPHTVEVATVSSIYPSFSQLSQVTPTSSTPLLPSAPAQLTISQLLSGEFTSMTSSENKIQLLGKHPANTPAETSSSKHRRNLYTTPVCWKPPTSATAFPHPSAPTPPRDKSPIPPHVNIPSPPVTTHTLGMKVNHSVYYCVPALGCGSMTTL